jgi:hypothetical protein
VKMGAIRPLRLRLTYALTPPNRTTSRERRREIAAAQTARMATLPIDALLLYDLQDESSRNGAPRPFPFTPKVDAQAYAFEELGIENVPRIIYRTLVDQDEHTLREWIRRLEGRGGAAVFVGAPSRNTRLAIALPRAISLCREYAPGLPLGGVMIAERHQRSADEDVRAWAKIDAGCSFLVTQTTWCVAATKSLLLAMKSRAEHTRTQMPKILVTLSPCGSERTLAFLEWLGVNIPESIQRQLSATPDMLGRSVDLAMDVFEEVHEFAQHHGIALGCNVESVSSRAAETDASFELARRVARLQQRQDILRGPVLAEPAPAGIAGGSPE